MLDKGKMLLTQSGIIFRGIRPLQKLGASAREIALNPLIDLALNNPLSGMSLNVRVPSRLNVVPPDPWPGDAQRGRDLVVGVFRFAGQAIEREELSWRPEKARPEWVAELHGFEWLRDLRSAGNDRARRMAREMVAGWIDVYQKPDGLRHKAAWQPEVIGMRLTSWISFHDFFCSSADDAFRKNYFTSIVRQARHLARAVPGGLSGLPLMRALKGLAYSGLALDEGEERLEQAFGLILKEIKAQILPDGAHISRAPQQTFEFLQCLVDLRAALIAAKLDLPEEVQHAIDRIAPAVKFFRHADGALSQFNGGQECNAHLVETTIMHSGAKGRAMRALPHCGYERLQMGRSSLIMDTGLAHAQWGGRAHAGLLSFEYSYGRDRVIVNCGTSDVPGKWRDLLRLTAAHSTLTADNRNACQIEVDGGRAEARPDIKVKRHEDEDVAMLDAAHAGYMPRFGLMHRRIARLKDLGDTLAGEDRLTGKSGVPFAVRFHLHPGVQASLIKDGEEVLLRARSGSGWRFSAKGLKLMVDDSIYCGEGETPRRTKQIVVNGMTAGPETAIEWEMRREKI